MLPSFSVRRFLGRLEARPHSIYGLLLVCIFTGIFRTLEEHLLLGSDLNPRMGISTIFFYWHFAIFFILITSKLTGNDWKRAQNAVYLGIFLGIFPPFIDLAASGVGSKINYSYYFFTDIQNLPYLFYNPGLGFPLGECLILWISVAFCGFYVFLHTGSIVKFLLALIVTYGFFLFQLSAFPIMILKIAGVVLQNMAESELTRARAQAATVLFPLWYVFGTIAAYCFLQTHLLKVFLKRFFHSLPFVLITLFGAKLAGEVNISAFLAALIVLVTCLSIAVQNDYFDAKSGEHRKTVEKCDMDFMNVVCIGIYLWLIMLGINAVLGLILFFIGGFLYNHPIFRIKKFFPGALKIESLWAMAALLTGLLTSGSKQLSLKSILMVFLIVAGWSIVSAWKDLKDLRTDFRLGYTNFYIFLKKRGYKLSKAHRIISVLCLFCLSVPGIYLLTSANFIAAGVVILTVLYLAWLTFKPTRRYWFYYLLPGINLLLIECLFFIEVG